MQIQVLRLLSSRLYCFEMLCRFHGGADGVGAGEGFGGFGADVFVAGLLVFCEDVVEEHGAEEQGHGEFEIEIGGELAAFNAAAENLLEALLGRVHDTASPEGAERGVDGGVGDEAGHHAVACFGEFAGRLAAENDGEIALEVAGVDVVGLAVETVYVEHDFEEQGLLVVPMVVDGCLADGGGAGDGVHGSGLDTALAEEGERGMDDLFVGFGTAGSNHCLL